MSGRGTGYDIYFACPVYKRLYYVTRTQRDLDWHKVKRTGRTRAAPGKGKGHPRKLFTSHEYVCRCGHKGWTCHADILQHPLMEETARG